MDAERALWTQVKPKRKQSHSTHTDIPVFRKPRRYFEIPTDREEKSFFLQDDLRNCKVKEDPDTLDVTTPDSHDIRNLIGRPVIRYNAPVQSVVAPTEKRVPERRGGLLFVNIKDPDFDVKMSSENKSSFDSTKEVWPLLDGVQHSETTLNTDDQESMWSSVVRAPPKPRPQTQQKNEDKKEEEMPEDGKEEEEGETKKKTKKKKKEKQKVADPHTLDLGALIDALKKSPRSADMTPKAKATPPTKTKPSETTTIPRNMLDSSAPTTRRGKEREAPKKKKLTPMRKAIIKEKEERRNKALEEGKPIPSILDVLSQQKEVSGAAKVATPLGLHNRKFRDYCTHIITPEINKTVEALLTDLVRFQDRVYKNEPLKLKTKRRYICGLREVTKHLELRRLKCVIVPPNLDKLESPGGVYQAIERIIHTCNEQGLPVVYALTRRQLAFVLKKKFHIGCVGLISYAGAEDKYKKMIDLMNAATREYNRKANSLLRPSQNKEGTMTNESPNEELSSMEVEESGQILVEEEDSEIDIEDDAEEPMSIPTSEWGEVFDSSLPSNVYHSTPLSTTFSWNISAAPFVPNFDQFHPLQ